ncbi:MAG: endonuclease III [Bacilli bacterium]|nr:endonuclease III [Bacilli bacterium]
MNEKSEAFASFLKERFPDASCTLVFHNPYEAVVSVLLSAQTNDNAVNKVTPRLFSLFPSPIELAKGDLKTIENCIASLGLYHNKAKNLLLLAKTVVDEYAGEIPLEFEELVKLPGVGVKTANVVLMEVSQRAAYAVDTHVARISKRLGYAKEEDEPLLIEKKLEKAFPKELWIDMHHRTIAFGRSICHAKNPDCAACKLQGYCSYFKKSSSTKGR